jgi:hypothetical protein
VEVRLGFLGFYAKVEVRLGFCVFVHVRVSKHLFPSLFIHGRVLLGRSDPGYV